MSGDRVLAGGGEAGRLAREVDWAGTPIGPIEQWSQALRSTAALVLHNQSPMLLWWGPRFIQLFNDAYAPVLGDKYRTAMGQPTSECWSEIWHIIGPMIEAPFRGGPASTSDDLMLPLRRKQFLEEAHFRVAYSAVPDDVAPGGIGGVLATVTETTEQVYAQRQMRTLRDLAQRATEAATMDDACRIAAETLATNPWDLPFVRFEHALDVREPCELDAPADAPATPWGEKPARMLALPLAAPDQPSYGVLVCGISPHRAFDAGYRSFLELVAGQVSTAIARALRVDEQRRRAEALAEIDRAKTAFFTNVGHEFRTPLTLMLGPTEDALAAHALIGDALDTVYRNELRMLKLVNALLDFSRIEAGRMQARFAPTDLAARTIELASVFRSAIERAGLRYVVDCPPLDAPIFVDAAMWEKIVLNLLSNALKFTFDGEIDVKLVDRGGEVALSVHDTGVGVPAAEVPRLFERFHRVEGRAARTHEGSGIGLALVNDLVRLHGGRIEVASELGVGTTFTIVVPKGRAHLDPTHVGDADHSDGHVREAFVQEAMRWVPASPAPTTGTNGRIVVADDNADMRDYITRLLANDYQVEAVGDGEAALAAVRANPPDLVLTDVMMPRLDGFGLLAELRRSACDIPVVMLSARAGEEARVEGLEAGADDYLVKPFSARELLARVRSQIELSRARRQAARQRRDLHALFEQAPMPIALLTGPSHQIELANPLACRLWSRTHDELVGRPFLDAVPELRDQAAALARVFATGVPYSGRQVAVHASFVSFVYAPMRDAADAITGVFVVGFDVTSEVLSQRRTRFLSDASAILAGSHDYEATLGQVAQLAVPAIAERCTVGFAPDVGAAPADPAVLASGVTARSTTNITVAMTCRGRVLGTIALAKLRAEDVAMAEELGRRAGLAIDNALLLREARVASRRKDEFLAMLGHELRNPLAPIATALQLIERRGAVDGRAREIMERQLGHMTRLVDDLLDVSRIAQGKIELVRKPIALANALDQAIEMARPLFEKKSLELAYERPDPRLVVRADGMRLTQIFGNVLANAARYTPAGGHVEVRALRGDGMRVVVHVRDDGAGIAPDVLPRIFELFEQGQRSTSSSQAGLGIGLAICKSLVEMHGGTIHAFSAGANHGSEFVIELPLTNEPAIARPVAATARHGNKNVLVVDDNTDAAELLAEALTDRGYQVTVSHDGEEALEVVSSAMPDVVLLDIGLPGMDGYEVAKRIRELDLDKAPHVVALSGYGQGADRARSEAAGFTAHLVKPVDLGQLLGVLESTV